MSERGDEEKTSARCKESRVNGKVGEKVYGEVRWTSEVRGKEVQM